MEATCVRYTDLPGATRLFTDLMYHPDRVGAYYSCPPFDPASYPEAARHIDFPADKRAALVAALRNLNHGNPALDLLARPGTVAVVTGQQVGLFSGPAYTVYKALTAIKLARKLTDGGIPAVPVFWLATEDHDFAEVNHCWVFDASRHPVKLEMPRSSGSTQPVGEFRLATPPVDELATALGGLPYGQDVVALVREAYSPGRTMGQAFSGLVKTLLARFDLLHIDPMAPEVRKLAAPLIRSALASAPALTSALLGRNAELAAAGYHAQVHVEPQTSLVFLLENDRRLALRRHNSEYVGNGRRFATEELIGRAEELSPNALLRPVVQDSILPTVAYVGGPAELAYLAQAEVIYRAILGRMPVPFHRAGFTLLDQQSQKRMARYDLKLEDFFHGQEALRERISSRLAPAPVTAALEQARAETARSLDRVNAEIAAFDPTLAKALAKSRRKIEYQLAKIGRKIGREALRRDERAARHAESLFALIYPHKHLQERLYSILPFLAQHGLALIPQLYENVRLDCPDHQLLVV